MIYPADDLPLFAPRSRLEEEFLRFHRENPRVLGLVVAETRKAKAAGLASCGIAFIWERLRWLLQVETQSADGFRLNNNHRAFYARKAMEVAPDLAGFFEVREQASGRAAS